jgi:hypothetical protein
VSFSFTAAGDRGETLAALASAQTNGNSLGDLARDFATTVVTEDQTEPDATHNVRYTVGVSGHSDGGVGSAGFLSMSIQASFAPKPAAPAPALQVGAGH